MGFFSLGASGQPITVQAIAKSDTTIYDPPLRGLLITRADASDTLTFLRPDGTSVAIDFPALGAGTAYPFIFPCAIRKVMSTGTDFDNAELWGFI